MSSLMHLFSLTAHMFLSFFEAPTNIASASSTNASPRGVEKYRDGDVYPVVRLVEAVCLLYVPDCDFRVLLLACCVLRVVCRSFLFIGDMYPVVRLAEAACLLCVPQRAFHISLVAYDVLSPHTHHLHTCTQHTHTHTHTCTTLKHSTHRLYVVDAALTAYRMKTDQMWPHTNTNTLMRAHANALTPLSLTHTQTHRLYVVDAALTAYRMKPGQVWRSRLSRTNIIIIALMLVRSATLVVM
jgi:hypothetical protein